jgi:DNA-binding GntR family transcriptional regulator
VRDRIDGAAKLEDPSMPDRLGDGLPDPAHVDAHVPDFERVIAGLAARIAAGKPGDRLPSIVALAREYRVGQTTVKDALRILKREGAIRTHPGKGTFIPGGDARPERGSGGAAG